MRRSARRAPTIVSSTTPEATKGGLFAEQEGDSGEDAANSVPGLLRSARGDRVDDDHIVLHVEQGDSALRKLAAEDHLGERSLHEARKGTAHRTRAERLVVAARFQEGAGAAAWPARPPPAASPRDVLTPFLLCPFLLCPFLR